jgi:sugar phosphate isomerase/epimerase
MTRRDILSRAAALAGAAFTGTVLSPLARAATPAGTASTTTRPGAGGDDFLLCLNTATIRAHKLGIVREIEVAQAAGYRGIEPWSATVEEYLKGGGTIAELRRRFDDAGLRLCGLIGFAEWIVDDDARRAAGLERAKLEMGWVAQLGGRQIAAPAAGMKGPVEHERAVERYRALLAAGDQAGVSPLLEFWGASKCLSRLSQCAAIVLDANHPRAGVLADVYHLYRGGSGFAGLSLLSHAALPVVHLNDYPAEPPREQLTDAHRVYPGDGVAPLPQILRTLRGTGAGKILSLEVFNKSYYAQDPLHVARTGLAKMQAAVAAARG